MCNNYKLAKYKIRKALTQTSTEHTNLLLTGTWWAGWSATLLGGGGEEHSENKCVREKANGIYWQPLRPNQKAREEMLLTHVSLTHTYTYQLL